LTGGDEAVDELLNNAPCGFLVFTDDGRIVEANATLLESLGYDRGELVEAHVEKSSLSPDASFIKRIFSRCSN
jgi:sigma-B regulation protein RsbU (phosphoserine phosphatase)